VGVCIDFGDDKGGVVDGDEVATNSGWARFGDWVDTLPRRQYRAVVELWELGTTSEVKQLARQLHKALETAKPPKNVRSVAENVLFLAEKFAWSNAAFVDDES